MINQKHSPITPSAVGKVSIRDDFWSEYIRLVREVVVPYQWEVLNDRVEEAEPSHAIQNFKIAAGVEQGSFYGMVFQDSDVAKWLEAVGYLLEAEPDPELENVADEVVALIAKAQQPDGYVNTYFTIKEKNQRWTNLAECHELYCAGHLIEAAVAYSKATGKNAILDVACRFADYIDRVFGTEPGKLQGYDGHQEIELALVKLYQATGERKYLELSRYFLDQRGAEPNFYEQEFEKRGGTIHFPQLSVATDLEYSQAHLPVREQDQAVGHAVRVVYMCTAMADIAAETGDEALLAACRRLWNSIVSKRMYLTGGIGSMAQGESFTQDYDLPNDTVYAETCASIGLIFFAQRMLQIEPDSEYANVLERALYNTVVSGMSRDGKQFFYVNPLEVYPPVLGKNKNYDHVQPRRQGWFGCACCPPNIARLLASLGQYVYTAKQNEIYTHLYIGGTATFNLDGTEVALEQHSKYAWEGKVNIQVTVSQPKEFTLALRLPDWSGGAVIRLNGAEYVYKESDVEKGYIRIKRVWQLGDTIDIAFHMPVLRMQGHPLVRDTAGKVALQRGPFVYCLEEADNGSQLFHLNLPAASELHTSFDSELLGGMQVISAIGQRGVFANWSEELYRSNTHWTTEQTELRFIPYFAWANREPGEMAVWINSTN
ncbi:glycoside hydrolase family 127 protein [Paenibacillus sinopodophylli]|uniref:glycoside hydrolase family 127 protein n=1 Tax=Paenibacillus sinopodophylli TaxID=1837342 RepID=UPI00110D0891|nr:beta-L-arabinofuranosidase domain-containing protein [Paenibacillus sinopodophylli]